MKYIRTKVANLKPPNVPHQIRNQGPVRQPAPLARLLPPALLHSRAAELLWGLAVFAVEQGTRISDRDFASTAQRFEISNAIKSHAGNGY